MKAQTIKSWFYVHKWTSLICTAFLLMLCLTGLPLIFSEEIHEWTGEDVAAPSLPEGTPKATIDQVILNAKNHLPGKEMKYIYWDNDKYPGKMFFTLADSASAPEEKNIYLTMDSRTAKVLQAPADDMDFMDIMFHLHVDMMAGVPGMLFLGFMGLLFTASIISGAVLYGPIMKRYDFGMIRTEKSKRLRWLDLHNVLGIVSLAWAFVVCITGVINTLAVPAVDAWRAGELADMVSEYKDKPQIKEGQLGSLQVAIDRTRQAAPDMEVNFIAYPGTLYSSDHHYAVYVKGNTPLTSRIIKPALIDAQTNELTDIRDLPWYLKTIYTSQPFHFGDYGGMPMKVLWALFDLATIIVLISGLYLWFARRKSKEQQLSRMLSNAETANLVNNH
ncbi:MAG: PepSY-associated TM helix domain-containing protein [Arcticibacter sp.]